MNPTPKTTDEMFRRCLEIQAARLAGATVYCYSHWSETWQQTVGNVSLSELSAQHAWQWHDWLTLTHRSAKTRDTALRAIRAVFNFGAKRQWCGRIFDDVRPDRIPKREISIFEPHELEMLLGLARPPMKAAILLGAEAGLRKGEIFNLLWSNVNFDTDEITVAARTEPWPWRPKDYESRTVPMPAALRSALEALLPGQSPFVLCNRIAYDKLLHGGWRKYPGFSAREWDRLRRRAKIRKRLHDLRSTAISYWANHPQIGPVAARELAGHADLQTTMLYVKADSERKAAAKYSVLSRGDWT